MRTSKQTTALKRALSLLDQVDAIVGDAFAATLSKRNDALLYKIIERADALTAGYEDILVKD